MKYGTGVVITANTLGRKTTPKMKLEKHLFVSDFQIPDHNKDALKALLKFIPNFKADVLHILGDFLNFSKASDYLVVGGDCPSLGDEIKSARVVLYDLVTESREANRNVEIIWYEGNHEFRLERFLARSDDVLTNVEDEAGEMLVSIKHIFGLRKLGIKWIPYYKSYRIKDALVEHGNIVRSKAGFTAQAQVEKYGTSGFSGHTHRMALITRKQYDKVKFWVETGSMCNPDPSPIWAKKPDWVNGFAIGLYDPKSKILHPQPILMQKNQFCYNEKIYS
jgi:UDP-2,3-diacylglucosamine pyrophosphatase LpxH